MVRPRVSDGAPAPSRTSLYAQVRFARLWLPVAIALVVVAYQTVVVPLGEGAWAFWAQLLFYGLVGPTVTVATLTWIATEVRERERAQLELQRLYGELKDSYAVLGALQRVTEQFASAPDLETVVAAAGRGVREVSGALAAAVVMGNGVVVVDGPGDGGPEADDARAPSGEDVEREARRRDRALREGGAGEIQDRIGATTMLSLPLRWGGTHEGSLHAVFERAPDANVRETARILAADLAAAAEAVQGRARDLITLFEVDRSMRAEGNLERMLATLVTQMAVRIDAHRAGIYLREEDALELREAVEMVPAGGRHEVVDARIAAPPVAIGAGPVGAAALAGGPVLYSSLDDRQRDAGGPLLQGAGSAVLLPLGAEEPRLGVIVLTHPDVEHFDRSSLPFLDVLASQVSLAVGNANAYRHSEELAIAEERARIAREIHDGVAQSLAFAALKLDLVGRLIERDPGQALAEVSEAKRIVREMIREVRRSIFALRPIDLERHGFVGTLQRFVRDFGPQNELSVELELGDVPALSVKSEAVLFRIFQEAMNNVAKHARARTVEVRVGREGDGHVVLAVRDDGVGFDPAVVEDRVSTAGGLGLRQMRERVAARGGAFTVESAPGAGTTLRASVPA